MPDSSLLYPDFHEIFVNLTLCILASNLRIWNFYGRCSSSSVCGVCLCFFFLSSFFLLSSTKQVINKTAREYDVQTAEAQVRDLDAIVEKLNSTFQEELKDEIEAFNFFVN